MCRVTGDQFVSWQLSQTRIRTRVTGTRISIHHQGASMDIQNWREHLSPTTVNLLCAAGGALITFGTLRLTRLLSSRPQTARQLGDSQDAPPAVSASADE